MKNLVFGLIATVMFGFVGNGQTDCKAPPTEVKLVTINNNDVVEGKIKIQIIASFGKWCYQDADGCNVRIDLKTIPNNNTKYLLVWDKLGNEDFKTPNAKYFTPKMTGTDYGIYIPMQTLIYNKKLAGFEANIEFYQ